MAGSGCKADGCAPQAIVALIISIVQCMLMAALQPLVAKSMSMGAAGCSSAGPHGKTSPIKFLLYLLCASDRLAALGGPFVALACC